MTNLSTETVKKIVSIEAIKELRARTHFGMTDCKNALDAADGNFDKAVEILQSKGLRKLDSVVASLEGEVRAFSDGTQGSILEVNCQTDFAARSELFQKFLASLWTDTRKIGFTPAPEVKEERENLSRVLGESVELRRIDRLVIPSPSVGLICAYNHIGGRIAVLVSVTGPTEAASTWEFAEHVAMHIAATNPSCVYRTEVPHDLVEKQKALLMKDLPTGKKPEQLEKILEGKMNRWYGETVLTEQQSVVDPKVTIAQAANTANSKVLEFRRFERGENK